LIPQLLSEDVDAVYLGLGGADAVNFLNQYLQEGERRSMLTSYA
jgi:branched-chain amino acid transport system substrate-binding protein